MPVKLGAKITPVAAAIGAVSTLLCCMPIAFASAAATASLSTVVLRYRPWLLGASLLLLIVGVLQVAWVQRTCRTRETGSIVVLGAAAVIVLLVIFFPQVIATVLADWLP
jgi:hypothetical protein